MYNVSYCLAGILDLYSAKIYFRRDGSGQQVCYGTNGELLRFDQGGGTVDRYHHFSGFKHFLYDVVPYLACCKLSPLCDLYGSTRPTQDCKGYTPPVLGNNDCPITTVILFVQC